MINMMKEKMGKIGKLSQEDRYNYGYLLKEHIRSNNLKKTQEILTTLSTKEISGILNYTIDGQSPFFLAVLEGLDEFVKYFTGKYNILLEQRCAYYDGDDKCHIVTPLWCAAAKNHVEIADFLLTCSADVDGLSDTNCTPVRAAAVLNYTPMVTLLTGWGADINLPNIYGGTCLMAAVQNQNFRLCEYLLSMGAKLKYYDINGKNAFILAQELGDEDIMKLLSMVRLRRHGEFNGMVLVSDWTELDLKERKCSSKENRKEDIWNDNENTGENEGNHKHHPRTNSLPSRRSNVNKSRMSDLQDHDSSTAPQKKLVPVTDVQKRPVKPPRNIQINSKIGSLSTSRKNTLVPQHKNDGKSTSKEKRARRGSISHTDVEERKTTVSSTQKSTSDDKMKDSPEQRPLPEDQTNQENGSMGNEHEWGIHGRKISNGKRTTGVSGKKLFDPSRNLDRV